MGIIVLIKTFNFHSKYIKQKYFIRRTVIKVVVTTVKTQLWENTLFLPLFHQIYKNCLTEALKGSSKQPSKLSLT